MLPSGRQVARVALWEQPMIMRTIFAVVLAGLLFNLAPAQLHPTLLKQEKTATDQPNPETVRLIASLEGPALYKAYCAVCHGSDARGGGPMALSLRTPPSDLTRIAARNGGVYPLARIERIISGEEQISGGHGSRAMPVWGPIFSQVSWDQDLGRLRIHNLAAYLGKLQTP
jgi:mono/diheme cytochrome c family protein